MSKIFYWMMLVGVTTSCNLHNNQYTNHLKELDALLKDSPEMVWDSLQQMDTEKFSASQKAYYYLLHASATDKNFIYLENDSTLSIALEYYHENSHYYHLARARYYMGKYQQKRKKYKEAYQLFKQAESNLNQSKKKDSHLLGLIYYQLALIQKQQWNLTEAEILCQKSFDLFTAGKDTISAVYALEQKGVIETDLKKYKEAEANLYKSLEIISKLKSKNSKVYFKTKRSILAALSLFHRKTGNMNLALEYNRKCLNLFKEYNHPITSRHLHNSLVIYNALNKTDSAKILCNEMIIAAKNENNIPNLINGYRIMGLFQEKEGKFREACLLNKEYNELKDSLNEVRNTSNILEIEKKYNKAEAERILLKAKNSKLKAYFSLSFILLLISIIGIFFYNRHKKLKTEYDRLSEIVKHTQWGFVVTKEFITENHIAYDELERMLNRAKGLNSINTEFYNKFHNVLTQQKASYSGRLFNHLTNSNGSFESKFQQQFPDLNSDDLLLATMIHHQWKISDMASILHISMDAIRKRKARLSNKISAHLKKEIDLDEYLANF